MKASLLLLVALSASASAFSAPMTMHMTRPVVPHRPLVAQRLVVVPCTPVRMAVSDEPVTVPQWVLRGSAFGSGLLGVLLTLGSYAKPVSYSSWQKTIAALQLGDWFPSLIAIDGGLYAAMVGWLFVIWSLAKAVAGTDTPKVASRFMKYNCWVVAGWPFLLARAPGVNTFGIVAFVVIFFVQFVTGYFPRFQVQ